MRVIGALFWLWIEIVVEGGVLRIFGRWDAEFTAGSATEFGLGAKAVGFVGFAERVDVCFFGFVCGFFAAWAAVVAVDEVLHALFACGAFGAVAGKAGLVGGRRWRRRGRRDVPATEGYGRWRGVLRAGVALLGRGLVDGEDLIVERPRFLG